MTEVRAAGAVLWQDVAGTNGERLVAVIHRPKYDDWSLPKGKLDPGEDDQTAALREIHEETAHQGEILDDLGEIRYEVTKRGAISKKVVRYFTMRVIQRGEFVPNDEVDELRWLPADEVETLLSYDRDREVLGRYAALQR